MLRSETPLFLKEELHFVSLCQKISSRQLALLCTLHRLKEKEERSNRRFTLTLRGRIVAYGRFARIFHLFSQYGFFSLDFSFSRPCISIVSLSECRNRCVNPRTQIFFGFHCNWRNSCHGMLTRNNPLFSPLVPLSHSLFSPSVDNGMVWCMEYHSLHPRLSLSRPNRPSSSRFPLQNRRPVSTTFMFVLIDLFWLARRLFLAGICCVRDAIYTREPERDGQVRECVEGGEGREREWEREWWWVRQATLYVLLIALWEKDE